MKQDYKLTMWDKLPDKQKELYHKDRYIIDIRDNDKRLTLYQCGLDRPVEDTLKDFGWVFDCIRWCDADIWTNLGFFFDYAKEYHREDVNELWKVDMERIRNLRKGHEWFENLTTKNKDGFLS